MKADVYTSFLTNKVKVFSTDKRVAPQEVSGQKIRRGLPLLVASLMMATPISCQASQGRSDNGENVRNNPTVFWNNSEFLSEAEVTAIMKNPFPAPLQDFNFNHLPENTDNFGRLCATAWRKPMIFKAAAVLMMNKKRNTGLRRVKC